MPNGVVTKGMVPPYPMALGWVPINGFTYDTASFWAEHENEHNASKVKAIANLFIMGNCIFPVEHWHQALVDCENHALIESLSGPCMLDATLTAPRSSLVKWIVAKMVAIPSSK